MSNCNKCGFEIGWRRGGPPWVPINVDGSDHRPVCGKMKYETLKATFVDSPRNHRVSMLIVGADYVPSQCDCGVPPWEDCLPGCKSVKTRRT